MLRPKLSLAFFFNVVHRGFGRHIICCDDAHVRCWWWMNAYADRAYWYYIIIIIITILGGKSMQKLFDARKRTAHHWHLDPDPELMQFKFGHSRAHGKNQNQDDYNSVIHRWWWVSECVSRYTCGSKRGEVNYYRFI